MTEISKQPCPHTSCGSSDAFCWNTEKHVGICYSCGQAYPQKKMDVFDWASDKYPLTKGVATKEVSDDSGWLDDTTTLSNDNFEVGDGYYYPMRGILKGTMQFYNCLTYDKDGSPHHHDYIYPDGGIKTRIFPKKFTAKNFRADQLFGMNLFPAGSAGAVTITEGELDSMSAFQMLGSQYPVVSLPSATPAKRLLENCKDWLGSFEKIYLSLDADGKAEKFAIALMNLFPGRVYKVPHDKFKDANAFLEAGQGNAYKRAWWNAKLYTPENIYASEEDFLTLLHDTPDHSYVPTNIKELDDKILGLMQGHFTVIKGPTGIGKSELMRYLEYNFISNYPEVTFASWHLEETKLRGILGLVSYALKDNLTRKDLITDKNRMADVEESIKSITNKSGYMQFHLREQDGAEALIDQIRILTQVYGCKYVLFEPIQDVINTGSEDSKEPVLADLAVRLSKLAADLNVGIVTIAHTNEDGEVKYCKMIGQRASVVIDLTRDKDSDNHLDKNTLKLVVKKNRPCSLEGEAGSMVFDQDTFTLAELGSGW